jgi:hypothetical protein
MQTVRKRLQDTQIVLKAITHYLGPTIKIKISNRKGSKKKPNLMGMIKTYVPKKTRKTTKPEIATNCALAGYTYLTLLAFKNRVATTRNFEILLRRDS